MWNNQYFKKRDDLIGKEIEWDRRLCRHRGTYTSHVGKIVSRRGNNLFMADGDIRWLPDLINVRPLGTPSPWSLP